MNDARDVPNVPSDTQRESDGVPAAHVQHVQSM